MTELQRQRIAVAYQGIERTASEMAAEGEDATLLMEALRLLSAAAEIAQAAENRAACQHAVWSAQRDGKTRRCVACGVPYQAPAAEVR